MQTVFLFLDFNWEELLVGKENWGFLAETGFRTFIMFGVILVGLRLMGKRGVKQLSVFELVVIIGLGSAAGDPMFYKEVGVLTALIVFAVVICMYRFTTFLVVKSKKVENWIEGRPVQIIKDGMFCIENYKKNRLAEDEFFTELRLQSISHLGQIEEAIEESSGGISIFYFTDDKVKHGLPVMPGAVERGRKKIEHLDFYSCVFCGYTEKLLPAERYVCPRCKKEEWVKSDNRLRIT